MIKRAEMFIKMDNIRELLDSMRGSGEDAFADEVEADLREYCLPYADKIREVGAVFMQDEQLQREAFKHFLAEYTKELKQLIAEEFKS